jgi:hypothetical protein
VRFIDHPEAPAAPPLKGRHRRPGKAGSAVAHEGIVRVRALVFCLVVAAASGPVHALAPQEIKQAAAEVAKDPDLGGTRKEKKLRLRPQDKSERRKDDAKSTLDWLVDLIRWISESGRLLVWLAGAVLVALLAVGVRRWMLVRGEALDAPGEALPTHVRGLDIRAESLPPAVGAAAARLWESGDHRAALSLLYRGALSRLVHRHAVPVRGSSTEEECLRLARAHVDADRGAFFARLVDVWQRAVYGAHPADAHAALELCGMFDLLWPATERSAA